MTDNTKPVSRGGRQHSSFTTSHLPEHLREHRGLERSTAVHMAMRDRAISCIDVTHPRPTCLAVCSTMQRPEHLYFVTHVRDTPERPHVHTEHTSCTLMLPLHLERVAYHSMEWRNA